MGAYSRTYSFTDGTTAYGSQVAFELDALGSSVNNIVNAQISSGAAIADTKLAQIATAGKVSGAALTSLTSIPSGAGAIPSANLDLVSSDLPAGSVVQYKRASIATVVSCSTNIPEDDTIPQKTEGTEVITVAITPKSATNLLVIKAYFSGTGSGNSATQTVGAFFQDTTANALYASFAEGSVSQGKKSHAMSYVMEAGTTSSTTFKLNVGSQADTFYVNGNHLGNRILGGVCQAWIEVWEIAV